MLVHHLANASQRLGVIELEIVNLFVLRASSSLLILRLVASSLLFRSSFNLAVLYVLSDLLLGFLLLLLKSVLLGSETVESLVSRLVRVRSNYHMRRELVMLIFLYVVIVSDFSTLSVMLG